MHRVLPDGCVDVVFINNEPPVVVGPWTEPLGNDFDVTIKRYRRNDDDQDGARESFFPPLWSWCSSFWAGSTPGLCQLPAQRTCVCSELRVDEEVLLLSLVAVVGDVNCTWICAQGVADGLLMIG